MKAICASVNFDVFMELFLPRQREHNWKIPVQNDPICGNHVTGVKPKTSTGGSPPDVDVSEPVRDPDTGHMISSVVAAALCMKPRGLLTDREARKVNALKQGSIVFAIMRAWPCASTASCAAGIRSHWMNGSTMPLTLSSRRSCVWRRDIDAVKNAIELPWSNGQGSAKRQMSSKSHPS